MSKQSAVKNILTFTSVTLTWQWAASVVIRAQLRRDGEQGGERGQPLVGDQQCEGSHSLTDLLISSVFSHHFTGSVLAPSGPSHQGETSPGLHQDSAEPLRSRPLGGREERNVGPGVPEVHNCSPSLPSFHQRLISPII